MTHSVRPAVAEDWPYVVECWIKASASVVPLPAAKKAAIAALQSGSVRVAHVTGDLDAILGFAAIDGATGCVLMIYTRKAARRCGVQAALFQTP